MGYSRALHHASAIAASLVLSGCGYSQPGDMTAADVDNQAENYAIAADVDLEQRITDLEDDNAELRQRVAVLEASTPRR